jgi:hypothetical protein
MALAIKDVLTLLGGRAMQFSICPAKGCTTAQAELVVGKASPAGKD